VADDGNPLEDILRFHAEKFRDAPGSARVARLARTAARIPEPLLEDLAALILQLNDVEFVGGDIALSIIEVAYCDARHGDATDFAAALRSRLQRYVRTPEVAVAAREEVKKRIGSWRTAIGKRLNCANGRRSC
jgi:hypothetical protein